MSSQLHHLIYTSAAANDLVEGELARILQKAQEHNARMDITGLLLYEAATFFQVLEGERGALMTLFERISNDPRHARVTLIIDEPISKRAFAAWAMGFSGSGASNSQAGISDFFQSGETFRNMPPGRARKILEAFSNGRWHTAISTHVL